VCICIGYTNIQAILSGLAYLDMIGTSVKNIEEFMKREEINW
jgi:hypothetical protein